MRPSFPLARHSPYPLRKAIIREADSIGAVFHRKSQNRAGRPRLAPERASDWRSYDSVAEVYDRVRVPLHEPPARDLVAAVAPTTGGRVLDVGTGTGVAAMAAAESVGPTGLVAGVDPSLGMLRLALDRGVTVVAAQAIDLPFRDATFDAVVANFVIFFFQRYETALFDMLRVLRPGGRLGVTTWGPADDEFRRTWRAVAESFTGPELLRDALRKVAPWEEHFSDSRRLADALRQAGLRSVDVQRRQFRATITIEDYLAGRETSAHGRFLRETLGPPLWDRFRGRVDEEFRRRFRDPIGDTEDVLLAVGTKPR
jgi:ubiquinone/menaquinone biosynthesis C-methylase UbiE